MIVTYEHTGGGVTPRQFSRVRPFEIIHCRTWMYRDIILITLSKLFLDRWSAFKRRWQLDASTKNRFQSKTLQNIPYILVFDPRHFWIALSLFIISTLSTLLSLEESINEKRSFKCKDPMERNEQFLETISEILLW